MIIINYIFLYLMNKFLKVNHFCKKIIPINRPMLRELFREVEAKEAISNDNNILSESFVIQSTIFHTALFNTVSNI